MTTLSILTSLAPTQVTTIPQAAVLWAAVGGKPTVLELAKALRSPKPRIVRAVDSLEQAGLVTRVVNLADRRQIFVIATQLGRSLVSELET